MVVPEEKERHKNIDNETKKDRQTKQTNKKQTNKQTTERHREKVV